MTVITEDDLGVLRIATYSVTQFDATFAAAILNVSSKAATRRLERLVDRRLLVRRNVLASPSPDVSTPLCLCRPGEELPSPGKISYQARTRWARIPVQVMRVYYASSTARALFGLEPVKPPLPIQATHDLGLSAVFLHYRSRWPRLVSHGWMIEGTYSKHRGKFEKVEDALIQRNGKVLLMVDFAGAYRPERVAELIKHARFHNTAIAIH